VSPGRGRSPSPPRRIRSPARLAFKVAHVLWLTVSIVWSTHLHITSVGSHLEGCVEAQGGDVHLFLLLGAGSFL